MAELLTRLSKDLNYIQKLGDNPNSDDGLTADALKEWFDKAPGDIKDYLNNTFIPQIENKFGSIDAWISSADSKIREFVVGTGFLPTDGSVSMTGDLDMGEKRVTNVADPAGEKDAVNKSYADAIDKKAGDAGVAALNAQNTANAKCNRSSLRVKLLATGWSGNHQTVSAPGVLEDEALCDIISSPIEDSREVYNDCEVRCSAQGNNTLTFKCDDTPDDDLTVAVLVLV